MDLFDAHKTQLEKVEQIMVKYPETRNCDKLLWLAYMKIFGSLGEVMDQQTYSMFRALLLQETTPTFESLSRARRKIQEDNKCQSDLPTQKKRSVSNEVMTEFFGKLRRGEDV